MASVLFSSQPASFPSPYSPEQAARQLSASVKRTAFHTLFHQAVVGKVTASSVRVWAYRPFVRNSCALEFVGSFKVRDGATLLEGRFSLHWLTRAFMGAWFCFQVLYALLAVGLLLLKRIAAEEALVFVLFSLLTAGLGLAIFLLGKCFARSDAAFISEVINQSIGREALAKCGGKK